MNYRPFGVQADKCMPEQFCGAVLSESLSGLPGSLNATPEPIAIIGMACRFPGDCNTPEEYWRFLLRGGDGIVEVPSDRWNIGALYDPDPAMPGKICTRYGGFLPRLQRSFDAGFFGISPREAVRLDPQHRLLLEVAWEALENAGQPADGLGGSATGVFIGIWDNYYAHTQLRCSPDSINDPHLFIGSYCNAAAGRLSYLLDLRGPSIAVDTACSSSLVALHLACQSLRSAECDLALVGGVNAMTSPEIAISLTKMRMLSRDGRCKTLDARADGFGMSEGCGVVVLKRMKDAVANQDPILAKICGTAVNEDGRSKRGLTAPNGEAQRALIRKALAAARLSPRDIGYVELHGTGTALGDTIEVQAIQEVMGGQHSLEGPLFIGSAKTNLGHMLAAAGTGGLIKTVLVLQNRMLPPHLHLKDRNPRIDWSQGYLRVASEPTPWNPAHGPRIAGVSSFGWAGTNAHAILEEVPFVPHDRKKDRPGKLLPISAHTPEALDRSTQRLGQYLAQHPDIDLHDVSYSLTTGRSHFPCRRVLICSDTAEAIRSLNGPQSSNALAGTASSGYQISPSATARPAGRVAFVFPGLDGFGRAMAELYETEAVFKAGFDSCCDLVRPCLDSDLRGMLRESCVERGRPGYLRQAARSGGSLLSTSVAQPLLFAIEYSLARLWNSWGIQPSVLIGYSLGEYVAACLAGSLTLPDALRLVAGRARLIEELTEEGAMLAAALPAKELSAWSDRIDVAGIGGPMMSVASGTAPEIVRLAEQLNRAGIACQSVEANRALHSRWMEPAVPQFRELLRSVEFQPPRTAWISTCTGTWMSPEQVPSGEHWIAHLRGPIQFSAAVQTLFRDPTPVCLEVGCGQTLGSLVLQHPAPEGMSRLAVVPSLSAVDGSEPARGLLLRALGQMWIGGAAVDWQQFYRSQPGRHCLLPTYPFDHELDWENVNTLGPVGAASSIGTAPVVAGRVVAGKQDLADWFHVPAWKRRPRLRHGTPATGAVVLILADSGGLGRSIRMQLQSIGARVILAERGDAFRRLNEDLYTIDPREQAQYAALIGHLSAVNSYPDRIVHLWTLAPDAVADCDRFTVRQDLDAGFYSLMHLAQGLGQKSG